VSTLGVCVLVSGAGTNLQALLDGVHGRDGVEIVGVASNRADAYGLRRAEAAGVPTAVFPLEDHADREARDAAMGAWLEERGAGLVVLAGYMQLVTPAFLRRFPGQVINIHPTLLPAFPGIGSVRQAVDYGVKVAGVTVHFVDEGVDTGPVILQEAIAVPADLPADPEAAAAALRDALRPLEHRLLPEAVRLIARGAVRVDRSGRRVTTDPGG
jgi:phosphoribosylglycinamide formyltransferase-1